MRLMVYPRDSNPYQGLLYEELEKLDVAHRYIGELTGLHTLNLALLPFELIANRARGFTYLHLHWVFRFVLPVIGHRRGVRRLMRWYLVGLLELCRILGIRVVWTAHNIVPHSQVFDDDELGRRQLTARCAAVIAHSEETLKELAAIGCKLPVTAVIPHGPPALLIRRDGSSTVEPNDGLRIVFVGKVLAYKGIEDLLEVLGTEELRPGTSFVVAGACDDPALRDRLLKAAARCKAPVELRLTYLSEEALATLLVSADVMVLPFRRTTSSGSVLMALGAGCPVIIPDLAALSDVPDECAWRYDGSLGGLSRALHAATATPAAVRSQMSAAAFAHARTRSWVASARATKEVMKSVFRAPTPSAEERCQLAESRQRSS